MCAPAGQPIIPARSPAEAESATRRAHTRQPLSNARRRRRTSARAGLFASTTEIPQQSACPPRRDTQCEGTKAVSPRQQYACVSKGWHRCGRTICVDLTKSFWAPFLTVSFTLPPPPPFPLHFRPSPLLSHARRAGAAGGPVTASAYHPREARRSILHSGTHRSSYVRIPVGTAVFARLCK